MADTYSELPASSSSAVALGYYVLSSNLTIPENRQLIVYKTIELQANLTLNGVLALFG